MQETSTGSKPRRFDHLVRELPVESKEIGRGDLISTIFEFDACLFKEFIFFSFSFDVMVLNNMMVERCMSWY